MRLGERRWEGLAVQTANEMGDTVAEESPLRRNLGLNDQRAWLETPNEKKVSHRWRELP
jgi:hypothetical protein